MRFWILTYAIVVTILSIVTGYTSFDMYKRAIRMEKNLIIINDKFTKDSTNLNLTKALIYKTNEIKNIMPDLNDKLKKLNISIRSLNSVSEITSVINNKFNTYIRDSIVLDTAICKVIKYSEIPYFEFEAIIDSDGIMVTKNISYDSLSIIAYKARKKGFFGIFKKRELSAIVTNSNPKAHYTFNRYIEVQKK